MAGEGEFDLLGALAERRAECVGAAADGAIDLLGALAEKRGERFDTGGKRAVDLLGAFAQCRADGIDPLGERAVEHLGLAGDVGRQHGEPLVDLAGDLLAASAEAREGLGGRGGKPVVQLVRLVGEFVAVGSRHLAEGVEPQREVLTEGLGVFGDACRTLVDERADCLETMRQPLVEHGLMAFDRHVEGGEPLADGGGEALGMMAEALEGLARGADDALGERRGMLGERLDRDACRLADGRLQIVRVLVEMVANVAAISFELRHELLARGLEQRLGRRVLLGNLAGDALARAAERFEQGLAVNDDGLVDAVAGIVEGRGEALTVGGDAVGDPRAGLVHALHDIVAAHAEVHDEGFARRLQAMVDLFHAAGQRLGDDVRGGR